MDLDSCPIQLRGWRLCVSIGKKSTALQLATSIFFPEILVSRTPWKVVRCESGGNKAILRKEQDKLL
jgi:hypothetical protein